MKVKDEPNLERNPVNGVIQNTNNDAYRAFIARRDEIIDSKSRMEKIEIDNAAIKSTLAVILQLLSEKQCKE